jgi:phosphoribosylformylglycinamidine cyclo-ligase
VSCSGQPRTEATDQPAAVAEVGERPPLTYRAAGVDIAAGERAVDRIAGLAAQATRPEVLGGIGGFAGRFAWPEGRYRQPVLVASTDGVGTKLQVARAVGRFDGIGLDLVAMCVDDLVCVGAEPLFLLDYLAVGRLDPDQVAAVVAGVAAGCRLAGCALLGGETAEHPGVMADDDLDLAGFAVGVVEADRQLGPDRVRAGDVLVGLSSPGLRSNGYSLARRALLEVAGCRLDEPAWPGASRSLGEELLVPSVIYAPAVRAVLEAVGVDGLHAAAHITGGGIPGNLVRVLPTGLGAEVELGRWEVPRIFDVIRRAGPVADDEMAAVCNLGVGMVLVVAEEAVPEVLETVGLTVPGGGTVVGRVVAGDGVVLGGRW